MSPINSSKHKSDVVQHFRYEGLSPGKFRERVKKGFFNKKIQSGLKNRKNDGKSKAQKIKNIACEHLILTIPIKDSKITKNLQINSKEIEINEKKLASISPGIYI